MISCLSTHLLLLLELRYFVKRRRKVLMCIWRAFRPGNAAESIYHGLLK